MSLRRSAISRRLLVQTEQGDANPSLRRPGSVAPITRRLRTVALDVGHHRVDVPAATARGSTRPCVTPMPTSSRPLPCSPLSCSSPRDRRLRPFIRMAGAHFTQDERKDSMADPSWHSDAYPELRAGPPWAMQEMIAAQPALAEQMLSVPSPSAAAIAEQTAAALASARPMTVTGCGTSEHAAHGIAALIA